MVTHNGSDKSKRVVYHSHGVCTAWAPESPAPGYGETVQREGRRCDPQRAAVPGPSGIVVPLAGQIAGLRAAAFHRNEGTRKYRLVARQPPTNCCAHTASGHEDNAPASPAMNSLRRIRDLDQGTLSRSRLSGNGFNLSVSSCPAIRFANVAGTSTIFDSRPRER